jgi:hypothetical protein
VPPDEPPPPPPPPPPQLEVHAGVTGCTVTVTEQSAKIAAPGTVALYVVVVEGVTVVEPDGTVVKEPTPLSIDIEVAFCVAQLSVTDCPAVMVVAFAESERHAGTDDGGGVGGTQFGYVPVSPVAHDGGVTGGIQFGYVPVSPMAHSTGGVTDETDGVTSVVSVEPESVDGVAAHPASEHGGRVASGTASTSVEPESVEATALVSVLPESVEAAGVASVEPESVDGVAAHPASEHGGRVASGTASTSVEPESVETDGITAALPESVDC